MKAFCITPRLMLTQSLVVIVGISCLTLRNTVAQTGDVTVAEVLDRYIEALGSEDRLRSLTSLSLEGQYENSDKIQVSFLAGKVLIEVEHNVFKVVVPGKWNQPGLRRTDNLLMEPNDFDPGVIEGFAGKGVDSFFRHGTTSLGFDGQNAWQSVPDLDGMMAFGHTLSKSNVYYKLEKYAPQLTALALRDIDNVRMIDQAESGVDNAWCLEFPGVSPFPGDVTTVRRWFDRKSGLLMETQIYSVDDGVCLQTVFTWEQSANGSMMEMKSSLQTLPGGSGKITSKFQVTRRVMMPMLDERIFAKPVSR